jgi:hypothetical protein
MDATWYRDEGCGVPVDQIVLKGFPFQWESETGLQLLLSTQASILLRWDAQGCRSGDWQMTEIV